jgi:hypothetical protein
MARHSRTTRARYRSIPMSPRPIGTSPSTGCALAICGEDGSRASGAGNALLSILEIAGLTSRSGLERSLLPEKLCCFTTSKASAMPCNSAGMCRYSGIAARKSSFSPRTVLEIAWNLALPRQGRSATHLRLPLPIDEPAARFFDHARYDSVGGAVSSAGERRGRPAAARPERTPSGRPRLVRQSQSHQRPQPVAAIQRAAAAAGRGCGGVRELAERICALKTLAAAATKRRPRSWSGAARFHRYRCGRPAARPHHFSRYEPRPSRRRPRTSAVDLAALYSRLAVAARS